MELDALNALTYSLDQDVDVTEGAIAIEGDLIGPEDLARKLLEALERNGWELRRKLDPFSG